MPADAVAARYAQALFETVKLEGVVDNTLEQLQALEQVLHDHAQLGELLGNPGVDPDDKVGIVERLLRGRCSALVRAFVKMVVSMDRSASLGEIIGAFEASVEADRGRVRVVVRSAYPLPEAVLARLRTHLAHRERKQIELRPELAPELLGGVQLVVGYRLIDGSVRRQLNELRERLQSVRVY